MESPMRKGKEQLHPGFHRHSPSPKISTKPDLTGFQAADQISVELYLSHVPTLTSVAVKSVPPALPRAHYMVRLPSTLDLVEDGSTRSSQ